MCSGQPASSARWIAISADAARIRATKEHRMADVNRRQFLQALAALGASISIPVALESANAAQVDEAWARALADPWFFEVNEYGTISDPSVPEPKTRADVFDISEGRPRDPEHLIDEVESVGPLLSAFQSRFEEDECDDTDEAWKEMVRRDGKAGIDRHWKFIDRWLAEPIDWDEFEWFSSCWSGQGQALAFFHGVDSGAMGDMGVVIVEGEHPGSSYYAAELRNELADANAAAERLGLPFRFRAEQVL
jgi:hypothetical protein